MNMDLRTKLKKVDTTLYSLGYTIEPYGKTMYISKTDEFDDNGIESYIRLYMHKKPLGDNKYMVFFTCEPCKLPGGSDYMDLHLASAICDYWKKMIKIAGDLTNMNMIGTPEEFMECLEDIVKRRKRVVGV